MKKSSFLIILSLALSNNLYALSNPKPSALIKLYDNYIDEVQRIDGDGLLPRKLRKKSWIEISKDLRKELLKAKTKMEIGRVFARLDSAYTNQHAHIDLSNDFDYNSEGRPVLAVSFQPEKIQSDGRVDRYFLSNVKREYFINLEPEKRPVAGDEILAINNRLIKDWSNDNFEYCKFPYRSQCEADFYDNFRKGMLSWNRREKLTMTLLHDKKKINVQIPVFAKLEKKKNESISINEFVACGENAIRYPEFKLVYQGFHACVYENPSKKDLAILRIRSFRYKNLDEQTKLNNVYKETTTFYEQYWKTKSSQIKTLVFDLVENHGGDTVVTWSNQFIDKPFQDQWVEFKNIKEFNNLDWQKKAFYEDPGKFQILNSLDKSKIKLNAFLPSMPQFCVSGTDCLNEKWRPMDHHFSGNIILITDQWCVSSCTGFAWTLKHYLGERVKVIGMPESGDSTYSRAYITGSLIGNDQFNIEVNPRSPDSKAEVKKNALFTQALSVSRSTDEHSNIISGIPVNVDQFDSMKWDEDIDAWVGRLIKTYL